jgi:hypothetical protein
VVVAAVVAVVSVPAIAFGTTVSKPGKPGGCGLSRQAVGDLKAAGKHTTYCRGIGPRAAAKKAAAANSTTKAPDLKGANAKAPNGKAPNAKAVAASDPNEPAMCQWAQNIPGQWPENRTQTCMWYEETIWAQDIYTGDVIGQMNINHRTYETTDIQNGTWSIAERVEVEGIAGAGFENARIRGTWGCGGACTIGAADAGDQSFDFTGDVWWIFHTFYTWVTSPGEIMYAGSWLEWNIYDRPRNAETDFESAPQHLVRCDDAVPYIDVVGCEFNDYLPTFDVYRSRYEQLYNHLRDALAAGLPGRAPNALHRLTDQARRVDNGRVACPSGPSGFVRPPGYECDEYPFRSTYEGAAETLARDHQAQGRTSWWCQIPNLAPDPWDLGWSSCMIPQGQNSLGGTDLLQFYFYNRLIDNDGFYVELHDE